MACVLLERTLDKGCNSTTLQFNSARGVTMIYNNYIHTTPEAQLELACLTAEVGAKKSYFTSAPGKGIWYTRFSSGCHSRMGDVHLPDKALTIDELLAFLRVLDDCWVEAIEENDFELQFELATIGTVVACGFSAGLRGEELGHARLASTLNHTEAGSEHRKPHVVLALMGRFKGVVGRKWHHMALAPRSESGIDNQRWLYRLLSLYLERGVTGGPLFRENIGAQQLATIRELDVLFHRYLLVVQDTMPEIIRPTVNVVRDFSVRRSLRRGATSQARNMNIPKDVIDLNNRWRKVERAGLRAPTYDMFEHYTDVVAAIDAVLRFSSSL